MTVRIIAVGLAAVGTLALTSTPAVAEGPAGTGAVGHAYGVVQGQPIDIEQLAACTVGGPGTVSTPGAEVSGFVRFGTGKSTCGTDAAGAAKVAVTGRKFKLDGLRRYGGPVIGISSFSVSCNTTGTGSRASVQITGLSGIRVPNPIPANHTITIPGREPGSPPVARIIVNEVGIPDPPDGSLTVTLMRVRLFPEGVSIDSGEVVVGTVSCSPYPDVAAQ